MSVSTSELSIGRYTFDVRRAGDQGEAVILLHGFPETSHMWVPLMAALETAGYQSAAADQRGYSQGARPADVSDYAYSELAADVIGLADALGYQRFHLIGHDHGAGLGWLVTRLYSDRVISWTAMSVPHIDAFGQAIASDSEQSEKSQYIQFFQQQGAAEAAFAEDDYALLKSVWDKSGEAQVQEYMRVFQQDGALTGALNWYRGSMSADSPRQPIGMITNPTLMIWGNQDQAIGRTGIDATPALISGYYRLVELDVGHWLIQEAEGPVVDAVLTHLKTFSGP
ncbi:MAG: alpha/beta hydrolase [Gammaproteobacteria bacterium]|jgi:pimeloyl-ACP methyl ester carboxylesterase|nr:alpha/beta hydrolase [Gammaproteobacteria bacterium]MBT5201986.1 alpha/beta hydrolase [Gammaproteobacteria bacterium]MBT5603641.1 alpha/beta hydrolase [Gammaproteobacteria bacterium]MBT6246462.1 alpha/beta hydrolase [Gammaproteobacteria bacterium]